MEQKMLNQVLLMKIFDEKSHTEALKQLSKLEETYEQNVEEFGKLFDLIYEYEETAPEFENFNKKFLKKEG